MSRYTAIKERIKGIDESINRTRFRLEQIDEQLIKEFKCKTVADAEKLLKRLETEAEDLESKIDKALAKFDEEYGDQL